MSDKRVLGIIGLGAGGRIVARRALDSGSSLVLDGPSSGDGWTPAGGEERVAVAADPDAFVAALESPRALLVDFGTFGSSRPPSGKKRSSAESKIATVLPLLEPGDLVMSCSGASYAEADSLSMGCDARKLRFVDLGVSGSRGRPDAAIVAAGCSEADWELACRYIGDGPSNARLGGKGSGNASAIVRSALAGLEIELLSETYHILKSGIRASHDEMRTIFAQWNAGDLADPLIAATADALGLRDEDGEPLIEKVLDAALPSGPCARAAALAIEDGAPAMMIAQAASSSAIGALKDERVDVSAVLGGPKPAQTGERQSMVEELRRAFLGATILAVAESLSLLQRSSERRGLGLDLALAARLWASAGDSRMLARAAEAVARGGRGSILLDASFKSDLDQSLPSLRRVTVRALEGGIPVPAFSSALSFYDGYRSTWLPANLSNALKDSLLGLGFERVDRPRGELHYSPWR